MKSALLSFFVFLSINIQAQMSEEIEKLIKLGRDSVIQLAIERLKSSGFTDIDPAKFDRLKILTDGDDIQVLFERSIKYVPMNTRVIHSASVMIIQQQTGWTPMGQDDENEDISLFEDLVFYDYTEEDKKAIDFVLGKDIQMSLFCMKPLMADIK